MKFKHKKCKRQRGLHTHGYGSKKKHRHAGSRGGRGNAGSGKRADQKKPSNWSEKYFGKFGFIPHRQTIQISPINIKDVEKLLKQFMADGYATEKAGVYSVDLNNAGYNKLLATGAVSKKLNITVDYASQSAVEKIKAASGTITLRAPKTAPAAKKEEA